MTKTELLNKLTQEGIHLWAEGDRLKFRAPKGALTEEYRTLLKEHKAELLQILSEPKTFPVSFAQQRLWVLYQLEPDSPFYNIPLSFEFIGTLDLDALTQTLNEIIRRHETLRTTFSTVDGVPMQVITPYHPFDISIIDLRDHSEATRATEQQQIIEAEIKKPFVLESDTLIRLKLFQLTETHHYLLFIIHHIIADGWSMGILSDEIEALYTAFAKSQLSPLVELPLQYADYTQWQRDWFQGERAETQLAYWQKQLSGKLPILKLPTDKPRPPIKTYRGKWHVMTMPKTLEDSLKTLSRKNKATLFITLLAAFKVLLYRYTQQTDILVGVPSANRGRVDIEALIGFFVNTFVLRSDLSDSPTFRTLLQQVRETALDAQAHQDLPFEKLVEALQPDRDLSHTPLFQVMFSLQNTTRPPIELPDVTLKAGLLDDGSAKFDLLLMMSETDNGLQARFQYDIELFEAEMIERMASHYHTLLDSIVANPDTPIDQLLLLPETEAEQFATWNDTYQDYPKDQCLHHLFEAQVEVTPKAIAVLFPAEDASADQSLTYRALNERANQLAHYLVSLGIGPNHRVGLYIERSLEMTVALLAIFKAGAAYVPLDPNYPQERLNFMLVDAEVSALLTQESLRNTLAAPNVPIICLDQDEPRLSEWPIENVVTDVNPSHPAYIIYTSGSTGRPKGVVMGHGPLYNLIRWNLDQPGFAEPMRTLQFTTLSFDASFHEMFATWPVGGTMVLVDETLRADFERLIQYIDCHRIERLFLPFVALHHLAMAANNLALSSLSLRHIVTAGEQLKITPDLAEMFNKLENCRLHNYYGPSESHVVTAFTLGETVAEWPSLPPIGIPIANTQIHLLDAYYQPVPIGIPGELYIGGDCLADGYLNRPELTAERFIDLPPTLQSRYAPGKLYKSGDLARYLPDGNIEFLGRIDHQVKIRGFRVELGEIETFLNRHSAVEKCVVVTREDTPGDKRLVAYVVSNQQTIDEGRERNEQKSDLISTLRHYLKTHLPDYMIPAAFVELDDLPINPNGKVDRLVLPAPDASHLEVAEFVPPEGPIEEMLAEVWQDILSVDRVGLYDNFFNLGGHSLLATRMVSRLRQEYEIDLSLRTLFEAPTIAELTPLIENILMSEE